jgi:uncharacterized protein YjbI with pentapeptide repeats
VAQFNRASKSPPRESSGWARLGRDAVFWTLLVVFVASFFATCVFLSRDSDSAIGFASVGVLASAGIACAVQMSTDLDWGHSFRRVAELRAQVSDVDRAIRTLPIDVLKRSVEALQAGSDETIRAVEKMRSESLDALASIRDASRQALDDAVRVRIADGDDHPRFNGSGSRFVAVSPKAGVDLTRSSFDRSEWEDPQLRWPNLTGSVFYRAKLRNGSLDGACFDHANLVRANFFKINLVDASFRAASLVETRFQNCELRGSKFLKPTEFLAVSFDSCDAAGSKFEGEGDDPVYIQSSCFKRSDLDKARFIGVGLGNCDFRWTNLRDAVFNVGAPTSFPNDFRGALLINADFHDVPLSLLGTWNFKGAVYLDTGWPDGFDADRAGLVPYSPEAMEERERQMNEDPDGCRRQLSVME